MRIGLMSRYRNEPITPAINGRENESDEIPGQNSPFKLSVHSLGLGAMPGARRVFCCMYSVPNVASRVLFTAPEYALSIYSVPTPESRRDLSTSFQVVNGGTGKGWVPPSAVSST